MQSLGVTMTRDCDTARIKRTDLLGLLDTMTSPDRQMVTARMPRITLAVPEEIDIHDEITKPIQRPVQVRFRKPLEKMQALRIPAPRSVATSNDVTLIGLICSLSLSLCAALAWLG
jgi:hypothetical protein